MAIPRVWRECLLNLMFGPVHYLVKQQRNISRNLLQSTDVQVQQISEQSGFGSDTVVLPKF